MKKNLLLSLLLAGAAVTVTAQEARLLRFPSTNGQEVVFSYGGDLYKAPLSGGEATRLTSHIGYEMFPRFSPDGASIAFTAQYDGNTEVYTIPSKGGEPKRMTYTSTNSRDDIGDRMGPNNMVLTWTNDGQGIIYRNRTGGSFIGKLWSVSKDGGMPQQIPLPEGGFCSYSPDGKLLAYNKVMREFRTWKYYKGGMADDIWIYNPEAQKVENITNNVSQDIIPMWIGNEIFFISDRDMVMNLFVYNTQTKQIEKVTNFSDYDIKFPSTDGKIIVFEKGGYLYKFDPTTRNSTKINITLNGENPYARTEMKNVAGNITATSLSPDGKRLAITARGEVFNVPATEGVTRNITRTSGAHERGAKWSPDGKYIAYISDRTGETEIWLQGESGDPIQLTKGNDTYIRQLMWSPDSKKVLYTDRKNRIVEVTVDSKSKKVITTEPNGEFYGVNYSPDSKWLTFTRSASNGMSVIYIRNLETNKEYPVTEKWYSSSSPTFSTDGKYLIFTSARDFTPTYGQLEWNHTYNRMNGLYMALLSADTPSPLLPTDGTPERVKEETSPEMKIDTEGIPGRIIKLPLPAGSYRNFYCDGKKVWYSGNGGVKAFNLATQKEESVAEGASFTLTPGSKKALFSKGRQLYVCDFPTGKANMSNPVNTSDMVAFVNYKEEWAQIYDEVWRAFRDGFYLENMHGLDWKAIKKKYEPLVAHAQTRLDLNYVIGEMIGEVGCGHAYVNPGELPKAKRIQMGLLGAELSKDKSGYYRIEKIIPGAIYSQALRSPLSEPGINVNEGEYIIAIDGISTKSVQNVYELLIGKANVLTELTINSTASDKGARKVIISPIADEEPLYHYNWVQNNIKKVEEATNGKVGYIYIPDMSAEGLNEFARYFYPQLDKEALIIDDRSNGGGNVSPMIIERLLRKPYRMTMWRGQERNGTIPDATHYGPKVLLIDKYSCSDGDLFPWSYKANNIGTVVGTRTWGGIVGISGSLPYIDGSDIRVPFFTNYDAKTGEWIVENHGVDPDILIDNDPIKLQNGIDEQLNKAIEVIMEQLKERKPLPKTPEPRTMKDLGW
ncbi:MAG: protease [Bacteroidales bacterium]|nr:protease [Bacteroidales bacterium]